MKIRDLFIVHLQKNIVLLSSFWLYVWVTNLTIHIDLSVFATQAQRIDSIELLKGVLDYYWLQELGQKPKSSAVFK